MFTVQNQVMFLKVGVFLYFLDLLKKCAGVCQSPCSVTGWGSWSSCRANGTQTRDKLYCCPKGITTLDACLQNCSITPKSPAVQSCVYTDSKTRTTQAGIIDTHASKYITRRLLKRTWILTCTCPWKLRKLATRNNFWIKLSFRFCTCKLVCVRELI